MDLKKMILAKMPKEKAKTLINNKSGTVFISYYAHWMAWNAYALLFGTSQGHERLEQRGGFGESELDAFYPEWRNHIVQH